MLTKRHFLSGLTCVKRLWWEVHDSEAPELAPSPVVQSLMRKGREVGVLARGLAPGGVLMPPAYLGAAARHEATQAAMPGATAIYEATFTDGQVTASLDILRRDGDGWVLAEVKAALTMQKPDHLLDVAYQFYAAGQAGVEIRRAELVLLNREHRHPGPEPLFVPTDLTEQIAPYVEAVQDHVPRQLEVLAGPLPEAEIGPHCKESACPFRPRCWAGVPRHHVSTLYFAGTKWPGWVQSGWSTVPQIPENVKLKSEAVRQRRSVIEDRLIVEDGLGAALAKFRRPLVFLDFETIQPALPVWPGASPLAQLPVQFSVHTEDGRGGPTHFEYLALGPEDCRPALAEALIRACEGTGSVVAYSASFERGCLENLIEAVPNRAAELATIRDRLVDLLPIVRDHVYHPDFGGSFSLKKVLPALVPELSYDGMEIGEGQTASIEIERLMFGGAALSADDRESLTRHLLEYCELDTWAMVRLYEVLRGK
jgi:hypothetical protein